ncbi:type II toxin-antitoxin system RelE/ParE family toxin [Enterococcus sp. AZ072]|uniref:type II toxin-antitoxin system RelE/ParE family toxin n=1 Tax=unclassified Enterococcus TaxID=2608891 RepID=UPI003D2C6438
MNETYSVEIKQTALDDMEAIYSYIVRKFKSIVIAEQHYEAFILSIQGLEYDAGMRPIYVERKGIHIYRKSVKNYMLLYTISSRKVIVLRVLYEKRNVYTHLN